MATSYNLLIKQRSVIEFLQLRDVLLQTFMQKWGQFMVKCAFQTVQFANGWEFLKGKTRERQLCVIERFKVVASTRKVLFAVFWDMEGVAHMEFLEQGQTVNSERYISTLRALKLRLRRVRGDKDSILQQDNAPAHQLPNSGLLKAAGTYDPTAPCIQPRSCLLWLPNSRSTWRAITMTMIRKLSQMFVDGAADSSLNSSLTACAN